MPGYGAHDVQHHADFAAARIVQNGAESHDLLHQPEPSPGMVQNAAGMLERLGTRYGRRGERYLT